MCTCLGFLRPVLKVCHPTIDFQESSVAYCTSTYIQPRRNSSSPYFYYNILLDQIIFYTLLA